MTSFGIPSAPNAIVYAVYVSLVGLVEGMVLVATPALVRDFSPQVRRGTAMGFWTLGPVAASLVVSEVASNTLGWLHPWQDQFHIAGTVGIVVFVIAFLTLRELSPALRDQLMVSQRERVLVEARARGIDVAAALRRPWRQMLTPDVVVAGLGVSCFLLIYYAAVGFFVIYFNSVFGFSEAQANGLGNRFWAADAVAVVVIGVLSDRVGVRKPFVLIGGMVGVAMTIVFATRATMPGTSYDSFIVIIAVLSASRGMAYAPWMAAFTETVERRNPALVATGLAVWAWILRVVVAGSFLVIPYVVTSASAVVDFGPRVAAIRATYGPEVATLQAIDPATRARLQKSQSDRPAVAKALSEIAVTDHDSPSTALTKLLAVRAIPARDRAYLFAHGEAVATARTEAPGQWQRWWWVCVAGELVFLPTILLLKGRWRPSAARRDADQHKRLVDSELARLTGGSQSARPLPGPEMGSG